MPLLLLTPTELKLMEAAGILVALPAFFFFARWYLRRTLLGSKAQQAEGKRLLETGDKARATVTSVSPTGKVVNDIYIQCRLDLELEPLDGSPVFRGEKTTYLDQTHMPRVGDVWPGWYDRMDRSKFAIGQPNLGSPESVAMLAEFGIQHPLAKGEAQPAVPRSLK